MFSEWERMLGLVRELATEMGVELAWHTGSVPQERRRAEITRFKKDPSCRLLLSTDSGSVGLNLQVASAVVNVDLPWNPARLEQRIARAWRKNQTRSVTVVNLVCEGSIEHGILHLLGRKQALADGMLDGSGDLASLKMPSGRAAFVERMQSMMAAADRVAPRVLSAEESIAEDLQRRHGERALLVEAQTGSDGRVRLLAVLDLDGATHAAEMKRLEAHGADGPAVEIVDRATWLTMRRLEASGMITLAQGQSRVLYQAPGFAAPAGLPAELEARTAELRAQAERSLRMARVLAAGGFAEEALPPLAKSVAVAAGALLAARAGLAAGAVMATPAQLRDLVERGALPGPADAVIAALWPPVGAPAIADVASLIEAAAVVLAGLESGERAIAA